MQCSMIIFTVAYLIATTVSAVTTNSNGTCTDPSDQLFPLFFLNGPDFKNICIASNITSEATVVSSFHSCCGSDAVTTISDGCYTYCNITSGAPQSKWLSCFKSSPGVSNNTMFDCFNGTAASLSAVGFTSTPTQTPTTNTATTPVLATTTSGAVASGKSQTSTTTGSASASNLTNKASKAGHAAEFSKGAVMAIALVLAGHFLA